MQRVLSSQSRIECIVNDILLDMQQEPRLMDGHGNAMLVCNSIYQACKSYEAFENSFLKGKVAIVTSYLPTADSIKGEETGEGMTEKLFKYRIYRRMIADYYDISEQEAGSKAEDFEKSVKKRFIEEPGQMRLLIVVDKPLTGFDAPSATYLYIDKKMADHNLFQAICRVNRLDGAEKDYGYIIDYQDLFQSLNSTISDYTQGAFSRYEDEDIDGLLKNRLTAAKQNLDDALEMVRGLCEPVKYPSNTQDYGAYFCPSDGTTEAEKIEQEQLRLTLYKSVSKLIRAYGNIANEMAEAGYSDQEIKRIKDDVKHFESVRNNIKLMSGDHIDMKSYEPTMRRMLDTYIHATPSETVIDFKDLGLIELIVNQGPEALIKAIPEDIASNPENVAETIENNVRKTIVDENPVNPKYYEHMSALLDELIELRRQKAIAYAEYLQKIRQLASKVISPTGSAGGDVYPETINTPAKRALYDNLDQNEDLADKVDAAIRLHKQADWQGHLIKERKITNAVHQVIKEYEVDTDIEELINLVKAQQEYQ